MKLLPVSIAALLAGCVLGVALAYVEVGEVTDRFAPLPGPGDVSAGAEAGPQGAIEVPEASVDEETHNFGVMQRGSTRSHEFIFTNKGDRPLTLEVGRTSCKCTLGEVADRPIEPGESSPVKLEWVAKSMPGEFSQVASVITNDPRRPLIELKVIGRVTENTSLKPTEFLLGRVAADQTATATIYVASYEKNAPPLEVTATLGENASAADLYRFEIEPVPVEELPMEDALSGSKVTVTAGPGLPIGNVAEWVTFQTNRPQPDGEGMQSIQVPLMAIVEGDISLHGAGWSKEKGVLNLGKIASREGKEAKLRLSFKGDHAGEMRASAASVDPEWLEVELGDPKLIREGVYHQPLAIRVPTGQSAVVRSGPGVENGGFGAGDARVRLAIENHPATSQLDVRVRFVIAE